MDPTAKAEMLESMSGAESSKDGKELAPATPHSYDISVDQIENPDDVIKTIKARLRIASQFREPFERLWRSSFLAWMQTLDTEKEDSWESKRFMPLILQQVETALPVNFSAVFNGDKIWKLHANTPKGKNAADALEKVLHWQASGPSQFEEAFDESQFWAVLFGTGLLDTNWSQKAELIWQPKVVNDMDSRGNVINGADGQPKKVKILVKDVHVVSDWPVLRAPNPTNVWLAPHARMGDKCPWFVEMIETTVGRIVEAAGHGHIDAAAVKKWIDSYNTSEAGVSEDIWEGVTPHLFDDWLGEVGLERRRYNDEEDGLKDDQVVFLMEYRSLNERITIAPGGNGTIIGYSENPHMHRKTGMVIHQFIPVPGCPYGRGLGPILLGHQELVNENINLFMDTQRISLMAPIIVNRGSINPLDKNFIWTPNKMIFARDVNNAAKRMEVPAPSGEAFNMDAHLKQDAERTTGYSDQQMGMTQGGVNTATESNILQTNAQTRSFMQIRRLQRTVTYVGQLLVQLNQQYMTKPQVVTIAGEDGLDYIEIQPWEIVGDVTCVALANASRANPALRTQQLIGAMQVFMPILQQGGMTPTIAKLMRQILKAAEVENIDEIIPKNLGSPRSAMVENVALENGIPVKPTEFENFEEHIQYHTTRLSELQAEGADPITIQNFMQHVQETVQMAAQVGMMRMQQRGGPPGQQGPQTQQNPGGGGVRPQATQLGAAAGNQGIPGGASPGPSAPPGRMM